MDMLIDTEDKHKQIHINSLSSSWWSEPVKKETTWERN